MNEICNFRGAEYHRIEEHCCHCTSLLQQLAAMVKKDKRLPGVCHNYYGRATRRAIVWAAAEIGRDKGMTWCWRCQKWIGPGTEKGSVFDVETGATYNAVRCDKCGRMTATGKVREKEVGK